MWKLHHSSKAQLRALRLWLVMVPAVSAAILFNNTDLLSDDAHRYRWDGWVSMHHIDPFSAAPTDGSLAHLAHENSGVRYPEHINNNTLKTIYPPATQIVFRLTAMIFGTSPQGFKAGWTLLSLILVAATFWFLRNSITMSTLYAAILASPILLLHGFVDIHVDILMALVVGLALAILHTSTRMRSAADVLLGIAIAVKYLPVLMVPHFVTYGTSGAGSIIKRLAITAAALAAIYLPFAGSDVLGSLGVFAAAWQANSFAAWIGNCIMEPATTRIALLGVAVLGIALIMLRHRTQPQVAVAMSVMVVLLCSPVVHPWYLALPLMLLLIAPLRSTMVWASTMSIYGLTYLMYKGNGVWYDNPIALAVEYVPVYVAFAADLHRGPLLLGDKQRMRLGTHVDR